MNETQAPETVEYASNLSFDETLERLVQAITKAGLTVFAKIDHAANARSVNMTMPPATVLIYGAAKGGTPIVLATPIAALDLPLRVLVHEVQGGKIAIAFHPAAAMLGRAGAPQEAAMRLEPAQQLLLKALAS